MVFPLRGKTISERSLEFNVISEALEFIRRYIGKAYVVGYTTRQEALHGLDISIDAPGVIIAAYQFKAPSSGRNTIYRFKIGDRCWLCSNPNLNLRKQSLKGIVALLQELGLENKCINQHTLLYTTALMLERFLSVPVYYAFPLVRDYAELESRTPGIIDFTVLIRVINMPVRTVLDCEPHKVEIELPNNNPNNINVIINSKPQKLPREKYTTLRKVLTTAIEKKDLPKAKQTIHVSSKELREILESELRERALQEDVEPELIEKIKSFAKAITEIRYSYRGSALTIKREGKRK